MIYDAIIIGGGPAGLMTSGILEKNQINYLLLEKNEKVGKKLLLTGGRRCNVTNNLSVDRFINALNLKHKKFLYHALRTFGSEQIIAYFKGHNLNLKLEEGYKYFPETEKSLSILESLIEDIEPKKMITEHTVKKIEKEENIFIIHTQDEIFKTRNVVIATGSNSFPTTGSNGDGIVLVKPFNIESLPFYPAETPVYSKEIVNHYLDLQGYSIQNTIVKINGSNKRYIGDVIFTHFGLSGPAIMHASEDIYQILKTSDVKLSFSLVGLTREQLIDLLEKAKISHEKILKTLESITTKKVAQKLLDLTEINNVSILEISKMHLNQLIDLATNFTVKIDTVESKELAYVNAGGILTQALNPKTMEVKKVEGLYAIGETVDLHGPIGGFNITIALSTGYICAIDITNKIKGEHL
ncbi:MAG: aminoacetone oxidase family FAD-binding enzyme [Acholeplasmataceae bacterium]|nr:aminoacetone oxidase family FAD-binding enzyme [Acholeplasmataceae bacterium]